MYVVKRMSCTCQKAKKCNVFTENDMSVQKLSDLHKYNSHRSMDCIYAKYDPNWEGDSHRF